MNDIRLADGSILNIKLNFLTMKILQKSNVDKLEKKYKKSKDSATMLEIVSKVIYAILRSNGKAVTEDEALMLIPMDDSDVLELIMRDFEVEMKKLEKKQGAKPNLMK